MFKPQTMQRIELAIPESDVVRTTEVLAVSGVFHYTPAQQLNAGDLADSATDSPGDWPKWANDFIALERRIRIVMEELHIDEGTPPGETPHIIAPDVARRDIERLEHEAETPVHDMEAAQRRLAQLESYAAQLEPLLDLTADLGTLRNLRYTFAMLGSMPIDNIERLRSSLEHISNVLVTLRQDARLATVMLFGLQKDADILNRAARSAYLNPLNPPQDYRGTPAQAMTALHAGIERAQQHIAECEEEIHHLHEARVRHLRHLLWRVRASCALARTIAGYEYLDHTYIVTGWIPKFCCPDLESEIAKVAPDVTVEELPPRQENSEAIPARLQNPPLIRPFQSLVTTYGQPHYGELDPTPMLALTFPLIFGLMFGDVGHGLFLALVGLLLSSRKIRALRNMASFGTIITACGIASMLFGFLYGSIFGFEHVLEALWVHPLEHITDVLLVAIIVGVCVLSLGMLYNMLNAALTRHWGHLLFDRHGLAGLVFYWALLGTAAKMFGVELPLSGTALALIASISGVLLTFAELFTDLLEGHRPLVHGDFGTYIPLAIFEFVETLISLFSNTLSYIRMGAFAVAHGALSLVVFIIAESIGGEGGLAYWIIVIGGNLFVIGFEGMIVGIQTLRLEYYELFSKFFSGGGVPYKPLSLIQKNNEAVGGVQ